MTVTTGVDVKGSLDLLKKAVSAVSKANKDWLAAVETFLEGVDTAKNVDPAQKNADFISLEQAVRMYLDEVSFIQIADNKLEARISRAPATAEGLSAAIKQAEAYHVVTFEAFAVLQEITANKIFKFPADVKADLQAKFSTARTARYGSSGTGAGDNGKTQSVSTIPDGLVPLINWLQSQQGAVSSANEPEGTDLLFGNTFEDDNEFLVLLKGQGNQAAYEQTRKLFKNKRFALTDRQIIKLTQSWGQVINDLIKDSSKAEADLILIHSLLETLYDRLESNVRRVSEDILVDLESPNI
ncbi:MAG: hypothetical protein AUF64_00155 [Chloroflexi bacterium 13_1_20CM_54_36]|jgi:hypothetical protein|nr:MAG: hypothetical protein AUH05_20150 [Ktedonobacter sp. 13_2_20CM_53_11]OLB58422.1 MAG: hypothetical protein AUI01_02160 [Ktedonobacter sp. 13_2_20CM_2_56_8]OLD84820.1 MAG: hypothetical protein AUF64_00155 [Chloroflexi bacterium 13_1_20CM_54_36]OLE32629.1 MAG: hypothetical protein AUG45_09695 [Ktedonobacter sp. 13_1_20CM_3_54_15]